MPAARREEPHTMPESTAPSAATQAAVIAVHEASAADRDYLTHALVDELPDARPRFSAAALAPGQPVADADVLARFPALGCVATRSTGFDHIDLAACAERGIVVCNVPHYGENTVAEHTFALILSLLRNLHKAAMRTVAGNFSLEGLQGFDLKGKTLDVIGAGSIGLHVIRIARAFGMRVLACDPAQNALLAGVLDFAYAPLEDLLPQADIATLHAPALPSTHHLIDRERLGMVKRGALLINTARGSLVDTGALLWALDDGILAGAGLDVLEGEELISEEHDLLSGRGRAATEEQLRTLMRNNLLLRRPDVIITPHSAFYSREALQRILDTTVANIGAYLRGAPQNVVRA